MLIDVWTDNVEEKVAVFDSDYYQNASIIRQGYLPFNPLLNKSVVSLRTVELYHSLFMRCPRLGIQPFVRALCDLQGLPFKHYLSVQFSSAYDLFVQLFEAVRKEVQVVLGRHSPDWRMLNACPCCQYEVEGEEKLEIRMMIAVDGNNSLKRLERRDRPTEEGGVLGSSRERMDLRVGGGDYFLSTEEVDKWHESQWSAWPGFTPSNVKEEKNPCAERWSNMKDAKTKKEFGYFDVTGVFVGLCRHRFVLKILDMVRSGEQSKYVLAFLHHFMSACKDDRHARGLPEPEGELGCGYDIACNLLKLIARSPLAELAMEEKLHMLIGLLHAYAHNRPCQLKFLMLYINGAGIEDLEVCERFFSQSNALASVTRHSSKFHRPQSIANYAYHQDNFEAYANLSKFIIGNYKQCLGILASHSHVVDGLKSYGVRSVNTIFEWLEEERKFLESCEKTSTAETLTMAYYLALVELGKCREHLAAALWNHRQYAPPRPDGRREKDRTNALERAMCNEQEMEVKLIRDVQALEEALGIDPMDRWKEGSESWQKAEDMVNLHEYHKALERLEGLIIARLFELSRLNVAGTGYKMRQHIGHAMQTRSQAIQNALERHNQAAAALKPPRPQLQWKDVLEYSYLSEFDFLRHSRNDIQEALWAKPGPRVLASQFFKLLRAEEELVRLHVEIQRLFTYMEEEEGYLRKVIKKVYRTNPPLAWQIHLYAQERGRFNSLHRSRLHSIRRLEGFKKENDVFFKPGIGVKRQSLPDESLEPEGQGLEQELGLGANESDEEDVDDDDDEGEGEDMAEVVLGVANDEV
ncbi:hypothetical protein K435DRAFT_663150 [Dendrothele bispora CBS 962.96]|uniref:CxC1-like cysteine cluster associated with KDZ transposases domain-containing protein n=1 Tax=Dendrothele bispora (strain CBS 962.96) TaxID=1314807 RepID=A0A4S8M602_DENBC|nr:hypothetical protein K435DRAFT_663150 [Dendrothele bispora CBS 962.96]